METSSRLLSCNSISPLLSPTYRRRRSLPARAARPRRPAVFAVATEPKPTNTDASSRSSWPRSVNGSSSVSNWAQILKFWHSICSFFFFFFWWFRVFILKFCRGLGSFQRRSGGLELRWRRTSSWPRSWRVCEARTWGIPSLPMRTSGFGWSRFDFLFIFWLGKNCSITK